MFGCATYIVSVAGNVRLKINFTKVQEVTQGDCNNNHKHSEERRSENDEQGVQFPGPTEKDCDIFPYVREGIRIEFLGIENQGHRRRYGHVHVHPRVPQHSDEQLHISQVCSCRKSGSVAKESVGSLLSFV